MQKQYSMGLNGKEPESKIFSVESSIMTPMSQAVPAQSVFKQKHKSVAAASNGSQVPKLRLDEARKSEQVSIPELDALERELRNFGKVPYQVAKKAVDLGSGLKEIMEINERDEKDINYQVWCTKERINKEEQFYRQIKALV